MEKNILLGESINSSEVSTGTLLTFRPGSFYNDPNGRIWCVINTMECIKGNVGLLQENGDPVDLNLYCIRVSQYAKNKRILALKHKSK